MTPTGVSYFVDMTNRTDEEQEYTVTGPISWTLTASLLRRTTTLEM